MRKFHATRAAAATASALAAVLLLAAPAAASEGHALPWSDFAWRIVNLIVFVAILWHFIGKIVLNFFRGRRKKIKDGINELTARREAARVDLAEIEARISRLESEREAILAESRAQAEALKSDILAKARAQADQIVAAARAAAESEGAGVAARVRAAIADEVVDAARESLLKSLDKASHEKLIDRSLEKVVLP